MSYYFLLVEESVTQAVPLLVDCITSLIHQISCGNLLTPLSYLFLGRARESEIGEEESGKGVRGEGPGYPLDEGDSAC